MKKIPQSLKVIIVIVLLVVGVPTGCKYLNPKRQAAVAQVYEVATQLGYTNADYVADFDGVHDFVDHYYVFVFQTDESPNQVNARLRSIGGYGGMAPGYYLDLFIRLGSRLTLDGKGVDTLYEAGLSLADKNLKKYPSTGWSSSPDRPGVAYFQLSETKQDIRCGFTVLNRNVVMVSRDY